MITHDDDAAWPCFSFLTLVIGPAHLTFDLFSTLVMNVQFDFQLRLLLHDLCLRSFQLVLCFVFLLHLQENWAEESERCQWLGSSPVMFVHLLPIWARSRPFSRGNFLSWAPAPVVSGHGCVRHYDQQTIPTAIMRIIIEISQPWPHSIISK